MVLRFNPPEELIQEYMNRKTPGQETLETLLAAGQEYGQRKDQEKALRMQGTKNLLDLLATDPKLLETPYGQSLMKQSGADLTGWTPPGVSSGTVQAESPQGQIPVDEQGTVIGGLPQGPALPGVGMGMAAQRSPVSGMGAPSPLIASWKQFRAQRQQATPHATGMPMVPDIAGLQGRGKLGEKAIAQYKTGLDLQKTPLEIQKLQKDIAGKGPLQTGTKEQFLREGSFNPDAQIMVEPPSNKDETREERLGGSFRKELTGSKPYERFTTLKAASENIESAVKDPGAFGDLSTLFDYMKVLDPLSVVREGEQEAFRKTGSLTQSMANTLNKIANGQTVTPEQRSEVLKYTKKRLKTAHGIYKSHSVPILKQVSRLGIDPLEVDPYYDYKIEDDNISQMNQSFTKPDEEDEYQTWKQSLAGKP